jgi:hypothetical protein
MAGDTVPGDRSVAREEVVAVGDVPVTVVRGGQGPPLLVLHDELGYPGWMGWNQALAER